NLASYLTLLRCDSLVVCGGTTSGCVRATVLDAFSLNYRVAVAADGCFDRFQASHQLSLFDMHCRYADVMPGEEIVQYMQSIEEAFETPERPGDLLDRCLWTFPSRTPRQGPGRVDPWGYPRASSGNAEPRRATLLRPPRDAGRASP